MRVHEFIKGAWVVVSLTLDTHWETSSDVPLEVPDYFDRLLLDTACYKH